MMGVFSGIRAQLVQTEAATNMETTMYFYPNPVENVLNVGIKNQENTALEATVYDMTGRVMLSQKIQNGQIDMSELVAGAYLVQIMHETEELSFKILKK
jgi:DNA gyrase inhibitor GyrI